MTRAELVSTPSGLAPSGPGWFTVNVRDAAWFANDDLGAGTVFEGQGDAQFGELGFRIRVLWPGQPNANYHSENAQEDFLVLSGECLLLVEGEQHRLGPWDFVHSPTGVAHVFVGAGTGPCVLVMTGGRPTEPSFRYPVDELAQQHGAGVAEETTDPGEAYARFAPWQQRRPEGWDELPWNR